jgi:plastocyanin
MQPSKGSRVKKTLMTFRMRLMAVIAVVLAVGGLVTLLPLVAGSVEPREILVVARQMSFYVGDGQTENPTIQVRPGERIRITLVNRDPGFDHDFAVPAWDVSTPVLRSDGRNSVVVQVPDTPGTTTYVCSRHSSMMKGTIEVIASGTVASPGR